MGPDERWFEALFVAHADQVAAYARRRCDAEPDDVVAEVFTVTWRRRADVPPDALPWLYRTAANVVGQHLRAAGRRSALASRAAQLDPPDRDPPDSGGDLASRLDDRQVVRRLFATLPVADVEILRLWAWESLEAPDIAYVLAISPAAARVRLHRARRRAAVLLTHDYSSRDAVTASRLQPENR